MYSKEINVTLVNQVLKIIALLDFLGLIIVISSIRSQILWSITLWYTLDQCTYFLYRLFDDENAMYSTSYDIQCWIRYNFIIKQPVQKISALIEFISKWSTIGFEIKWTKWLPINLYRASYYAWVLLSQFQLSLHTGFVIMVGGNFAWWYTWMKLLYSIFYKLCEQLSCSYNLCCIGWIIIWMCTCTKDKLQ